MRALLIALVFALAFAGSTAQADTSSTSEIKDEKTYGNCQVQTSVDTLTQEKTFFLKFRGEGYPVSSPDITIMHDEYGLTLSLHISGTQFRWDVPISIAIRFPSHPIIERQADLMGIIAFIFHEDVFIRSLLPQFAMEGNLFIQVGTKSGVIDLTGAAQAVQDFQRRISTR